MEPVEWAIFLANKVGYQRIIKWIAILVGGALFTVVLIFPLMIGGIFGSTAGSDEGGGCTNTNTAEPAPAPAPVSNGSNTVPTDAEAHKNVVIVIARAMHAGLGSQGAIVALATVGVETGGTFHSLNYGDRDSLGMFQQRPSSGWGTPAQIKDPVLSADAFYGTATHTHNTGLKGISGWRSMPVWQAAQSVQRSGFPHRYADWQAAAQTAVSKYWDEAARSSYAGSANKPAASPSPVDAGATTVVNAADAPTENPIPTAISGTEAPVQDCCPPGGGVTAQPVNNPVPASTSSTPPAKAGSTPDVSVGKLPGAPAPFPTGGLKGVSPAPEPTPTTSEPTTSEPGTVEPGTGDASNCAPAEGAAAGPIGSTTSDGKFANPLAGESYTLTSGFGPRKSPGGIGSTNHLGQDMAAPTGTKIKAACSGTVFVVQDPLGGMGQGTIIDCGSGIHTLYGHQSKMEVKVGQKVKMGQEIGLVGSTGNSTGPHLHYAVHLNANTTGSAFNGTPIDPAPFMRSHGAPL